MKVLASKPQNSSKIYSKTHSPRRQTVPGGNATLGSTVAGTAGLTEMGGGILILTRNNNYIWKGAAVIGGNVGGIRHQIEDGVSGFLVDNVEQAAEHIVRLVKDEALRRRLGERAKESVRKRFLMTRLMEDWLDLITSFEAVFRPNAQASSDGREHEHVEAVSSGA